MPCKTLSPPPDVVRGAKAKLHIVHPSLLVYSYFIQIDTCSTFKGLKDPAYLLAELPRYNSLRFLSQCLHRVGTNTSTEYGCGGGG